MNGKDNLRYQYSEGLKKKNDCLFQEGKTEESGQSSGKS